MVRAILIRVQMGGDAVQAKPGQTAKWLSGFDFNDFFC